jgi:hypothetical protein
MENLIEIAVEKWEKIKNETEKYANKAEKVGDAGLAIINIIKNKTKF